MEAYAAVVHRLQGVPITTTAAAATRLLLAFTLALLLLPLQLSLVCVLRFMLPHRHCLLGTEHPASPSWLNLSGWWLGQRSGTGMAHHAAAAAPRKQL